MSAYRYPESHVFYRKLGRPYPRIVRGEGCWLYDEQGKRYLDACGGAFVANLGHSNPDVADALARQARQFGYLSATAFTHEPIEQLAAELAATLPGDLDKLYFLSSGSEAVEEAILRLGAEHVAAFIAEPVGGSSTGASTPRPDYFRRIREICDRHEVLFIADEILCGAGRTGAWWAIEPYGAVPDIMTL